MRGRVALLLGVLLVALMAAPQFTAAPGGIGSAGDQGCTCHGGASPDTTVLVDGLPETYNASETYTFTVTVQNDVMDINDCLLYTSPSPRDLSTSRMPSSA